jgi:predicted nucleotidyltransferase component of viral defense system
MKLHLNNTDFAELINNSADYLNINKEYVEKDYWLTLILQKLSQSKYADSVVFKGGTSLSKAYRLINRFSEDVGLRTN